jgi:hypothetical protein
LVRSFRKPFQHQHDTSWWQPFFRRYLLILLIALFTTAAQNVSEIEAPPTLPARTLATAALLAGQGFRVDSPVPTDGLTALFTIRSSVGTFSAPGLEMLKDSARGVAGYRTTATNQQNRRVCGIAGKNAVRPIQAAGQMLMNPIDTAGVFGRGSALLWPGGPRCPTNRPSRDRGRGGFGRRQGYQRHPGL